MVHGNGYLDPFPKSTLSHPSYHLSTDLMTFCTALITLWLEWHSSFASVNLVKNLKILHCAILQVNGKEKEKGVKSSASIRIRYSIVQNRHPMLIFMLYIHRVWRQTFRDEICHKSRSFGGKREKKSVQPNRSDRRQIQSSATDINLNGTTMFLN